MTPKVGDVVRVPARVVSVDGKLATVRFRGAHAMHQLAIDISAPGDGLGDVIDALCGPTGRVTS